MQTTPTADIAIREAVRDDFDFIVELINEALEPYYDGDHRAHARRIFETHIAGGIDHKGHFSREQRMFIAMVNGERAGVLHLVGKKQGTYKISPIIVDQKFRGLYGIGRSMLQHAESYTRGRSARNIYGTVADQNHSAMQFFKRNCYLIAGSSDSHYKHGVREFMFYKPLISENVVSQFEITNISVIPMENCHQAAARILMLDMLPKHFNGVTETWVDALYNGYNRRHSGDVNEKYKLVFVAVNTRREVLGIAGATPKKGEPIKVMPLVARTLPAFSALLTDIPNLLKGRGHKLYTHQVPTPEQVMLLQGLGWNLDCMLPAAYHDEHTTQQWSFTYGDMFMRKMRVKNPLLQQIKSGEKTLEVRVGYDNIKTITIGERIELLSQSDRQVIKVVGRRTYRNLDELSRHEPLEKIVPGITTKDALNFLKRIYPPQKQKLGIYVFELVLE
ncbi:MAG: GNAT family N-acetyltransferase [Patescibacteria group bacterium]